MPLNSTRGGGSAKALGLASAVKIYPYTLDFLVVAGGGGGGYGIFHGGGGGAGGYRTNNYSITGKNTVVNVTVGDGASGGTVVNQTAPSGSSPSISKSKSPDFTKADITIFVVVALVKLITSLTPTSCSNT